MKRKPKLLIFLLIISILSLFLFFLQYQQNIPRHTQTNVANELYKTHMLGGFSIDTPEKAMKAAADGVQVVFQYGQPPSESDKLGQKLQSLHMKVVDAMPWTYLYYYECHRIKAVKPPPASYDPYSAGYDPYCPSDDYPEITSESVLLQYIAAHFQQVKDNPLIVGYWVLDDWIPWDAGSAKQILMDIHKLIQQYTPGRPAICGFGGTIWLNHEYGWDDWIADNFSPDGCDKIGLYIYTSSIENTTPLPSPALFNWSMAGVLPAVFKSLQQRGWNIKKEPLIGIEQAFGGPPTSKRYYVPPSAKGIEIQSRTFCEQGATGLVFYAWDDSGWGPATQMPMNSTEIETGIRNGIAACKQYWSKHP